MESISYVTPCSITEWWMKLREIHSYERFRFTYCTFYVKGKYLDQMLPNPPPPHPPEVGKCFSKTRKTGRNRAYLLKDREELEKWAGENIEILGHNIFPWKPCTWTWAKRHVTKNSCSKKWSSQQILSCFFPSIDRVTQKISPGIFIHVENQGYSLAQGIFL